MRLSKRHENLLKHTFIDYQQTSEFLENPIIVNRADGLYYWDGQKWVSTLSPDGRFRWNGTAWVPVAGIPAPGYAQYQLPRSVRVPTSWTQPMQIAVVAWYVLSGFSLVTRCDPRTLVNACRIESRLTPFCFRSCADGERPLSSASAMKRCSVLTNSSFRRSASACA